VKSSRLRAQHELSLARAFSSQIGSPRALVLLITTEFLETLPAEAAEATKLAAEASDEEFLFVFRLRWPDKKFRGNSGQSPTPKRVEQQKL
jgi:hypothetical protein